MTDSPPRNPHLPVDLQAQLAATEIDLLHAQEDAENLVKIAGVLASDLDYEGLCRHALEFMKWYANLNRATLYMAKGQDGAILKPLARVNSSHGLESMECVDLTGNAWFQRAMRATEPLLTLDVKRDPSCAGSPFELADLRSLLVVPMRLAEGQAAYLAVGNSAADDAIVDGPRLRLFLSRLGVLLATAMDRVTTLMQRHDMEQQLHHANKLEAVGLLAGGVAHNFNNTLTVILGHCSVLTEEPSLTTAARGMVEAIQRAGECSVGAVRQLLAFSRKQVLDDVRAIDVAEVLKSMDLLLRPLIGGDLDLNVDLGSDLGQVRMGAGELEMLLMNLAVNSLDAMPDGGRLEIRARRIQEQGRGSVLIEVEDNGTGMSPDTLERVFEPFFTTKSEGHGTGLGLSAVYGVIQKAQGSILVESKAGAGTKFRMHLPPTAERADDLIPTPVGSRRSGIPAHILLVEDQPLVRDLTVRALRARGFQVTAASDGAEASELVRESSADFDMFLSDVVMPPVNGHQLAELFSARHPKKPVLLMSGFSHRTEFPEVVKANGTPVLPKPFTISELMAAVGTTLGEAAG